MPRNYLNGKYVRFRWEGYQSYSPSTRHWVLIYDGSYDRSNDTDFPNGSGIPTKGQGLLQTLASKDATFAAETVDTLIDVSAGTEEYCTIFFRLSDAWSGQNLWQQIEWFEINEAAGGAQNLWLEEFDDSVNMEKTGSTGDYGYISTGNITTNFDSVDYPVRFHVPPSGSVNYSVRFHVPSTRVDLPARFILQNIGSTDFLAVFKTRVGSVDYLTKFIVRNNYLIDYLTKFQVRKRKYADFRAKFKVTEPSSIDYSVRLNVPPTRINLPIRFKVRHPDSKDLPVVFQTGVGWKDFLCVLNVLHPHWEDWTPYYAVVFALEGANTGSVIPFFVKDSLGREKRIQLQDNYLGWRIWIIRFKNMVGPASFDWSLVREFGWEFQVSGIHRIDHIMLLGCPRFLCKFKVRGAHAFQDYLGKFVIRRSLAISYLSEMLIANAPGRQDLPAEMIVLNKHYEDLPSETTIVNSDSIDIISRFRISKGTISRDLLGTFVVARLPGSRRLISRLTVRNRASKILPTRLVSRHHATIDLPCQLIVVNRSVVDLPIILRIRRPLGFVDIESAAEQAVETFDH